MTKNFALLDYDGFICKAWFAAKARDDRDDPFSILGNLTNEAYFKARSFFNGDNFEFIPIASGHTFKKDMFDTYKETRKKDEGLGEFRTEQIERRNIYRPNDIEADDMISILLDTVANIKDGKALVFTDDKDLKYISENHCGVNIQSEVQSSPVDKDVLLQQMIAGDSEDDIKGIDKFGMKKARKLLEKISGIPSGFNIADVVRAYRSQKCGADYTVKQLILVSPIKAEFNAYSEELKIVGDLLLSDGIIENNLILDLIDGHKIFFNNLIKEVYKDEK